MKTKKITFKKLFFLFNLAKISTIISKKDANHYKKIGTK